VQATGHHSRQASPPACAHVPDEQVHPPGLKVPQSASAAHSQHSGPEAPVQHACVWPLQTSGGTASSHAVGGLTHWNEAQWVAVPPAAAQSASPQQAWHRSSLHLTGVAVPAHGSEVHVSVVGLQCESVPSVQSVSPRHCTHLP
jgi:hypothetical protein